MEKKTMRLFAIAGLLILLISSVGIGITTTLAQTPPNNPGQGPPDNPGQGPPENPGQGPGGGNQAPPQNPGQGPDNPGQGPPENPGNQPGAGNQGTDSLASFQDTTPVGNTAPDSLSGKIRVEQEHEQNTSVELVRNSSTNYTLNINVTGNATNVTFYLQQQAISSSQNISNFTMYLDGQQHSFYPNAGPGNSPWAGFEIEHFSVRTISFIADTQNNNGGNGGNNDGGYGGIGDGSSDVVDQYAGNDGDVDGAKLGRAITCYVTGNSCIGDKISPNELGQLITEYVL